MQTWLDILKPNTTKMVHNHNNKTILLIHPHWSKDKSTSLFRQLLHGIKNNNYRGYLVTAVGFISLEGMIIVHRIQQYLNKLDNVEYTKYTHNLHQGTYNLEVKFK